MNDFNLIRYEDMFRTEEGPCPECRAETLRRHLPVGIQVILGPHHQRECSSWRESSKP